MMEQPNAIMVQPTSFAQQIGESAIAFERRRTGHNPQSVTVVLSESTIVITVHGALSPAEKALAKSAGGAAQLQEFHRQLFKNNADSLLQAIKSITGVEVCEAVVEVDPTIDTAHKTCTTGNLIQVFLLARNVPPGTWSGCGPPDHY